MARADIDREGLVLHGAPDEPLLVFFDDQYVWSFTPSRDGSVSGAVATVSWPRVLRPFLIGSTRLRLATYDGGVVVHDDEVAFSGSAERVAFVDESGSPYSIDKVGHLTRSFEETSADMKAELLAATQTVLRELHERCGVEAYLCYGALLGAVRQGTMLGHDSDVDLCYYSRHGTPADIIAESYRVQRALSELDWTVLRMSAGDLKVIWPLSDGSNAHIDVFSAFTISSSQGDVFYQFGNRNGLFDVDAHLLPLGTVTLEGQEFPAPKDPEAMLTFVYGPKWRVPDPGFRYQDNPLGVRRLDGWFRGLRAEVPLWLSVFQPPALDRVPETPSSFAQWVSEQLAPDAALVDLGAGTGRDALWFGASGRKVLAMDYSRPGLQLMRRRRAAAGLTEEQVAVEIIVLNDLRLMMSLLSSLAREPRDLYARGLIGSLDEDARHQLLRLASATLRGRGHALWLEFSAQVDGAGDVPLPEPRPLTRRFSPHWLTGEIESHGGTVEFLEIGPGTDMFDQPDPFVARMKVVWPHPRQA
ncbi:class I SAM-dependent methyltransferase [Nocardioides sp. Kera G14]|uniref:class I SAM-dependent methyltransferase n=1 Tax=Nocardioides sp. Kera G14 TaxID=2884264 RepID=UPI001D10AD0A|nr:class I SAM-dependent methyltransferase [Nocardioides sp. Kera G14]UDY23009.1 class I SAM-dependent methyltransferase [Nocardioides sp. Kera G14]